MFQAVALLFNALVLLPIATAASQPDPTWIEGIYDLADGDDVVTLVNQTAASKRRAPSPLAIVTPRTYNFVSPPRPGRELTTHFTGRYESLLWSGNTRGPPQPSRLGVKRALSTASWLICSVITTPALPSVVRPGRTIPLNCWAYL